MRDVIKKIGQKSAEVSRYLKPDILTGCKLLLDNKTKTEDNEYFKIFDTEKLFFKKILNANYRQLPVKRQRTKNLLPPSPLAKCFQRREETEAGTRKLEKQLVEMVANCMG